MVLSERPHVTRSDAGSDGTCVLKKTLCALMDFQY